MNANSILQSWDQSTSPLAVAEIAEGAQSKRYFASSKAGTSDQCGTFAGFIACSQRCTLHSSRRKVAAANETKTGDPPDPHLRRPIMLATLAQCLKMLLLLAGTLGACLVHAQSVQSNAREPAWIQAPAPLPAGAQIAMLKGELTQPGPLAFRLKLPPEYRLDPHSSTAMRRIVVVSGALYLGAGEKFDSARAVPLHAGYVHWPNNGSYFAFTKEETVVEVEGSGPWTLRYVGSGKASKEHREAKTAVIPARAGIQ